MNREKPFLVLSGIVAFTALVGISYLLVVVFLDRVNKKDVVTVPKVELRRVWVSKILTQCDEVWQKRKISFEKYADSLGVEVFDRMIVPDQLQRGAVCTSCSCPSGEIMYLSVNKEALEDLVGFVESGPPKEK